MSDSLFDVAAEEKDQSAPEREYPITDTQVAQIRAEFVRLGVDSMNSRQELIESAAIRSVEKLRDLSAVEARRVLNLLRARTAAHSTASGSAWDTREKDTWIDKL